MIIYATFASNRQFYVLKSLAVYVKQMHQIRMASFVYLASSVVRFIQPIGGESFEFMTNRVVVHIRCSINERR